MVDSEGESRTRTASPQKDNELDLDPRWLVGLVRRRWKVVGAGAFIINILGVIYITLATPLYTATAEVILNTGETNLVDPDSESAPALRDSASVATEVAIIKSIGVASRAAEQLGLRQSTAEAQTATDGYSLFTDIFGAGAAVQRQAAVRAETNNQQHSDLRKLDAAGRAAISRIIDSLDVSRQFPSYIIEISYTDPAAKVAAEIANAVAEAYLVEQLEARYTASKRAAQWLSERVAEVRLDLDTAERAVAQHRLKYKLGEADRGTLVEQQIADINEKLIAARAETVEKRTNYEYAKGVLENNGNIASIEEVTESPIIGNLRDQEQGVRRRLADLSGTYGPKHPKIVNARAELSDVERQIQNEMARIVETLESEYQAATKREQSLEESLQELTESDMRDAAVRELRRLEREVVATRSLYESMLIRSKKAQQQSALSIPDARIVTPAEAPEAPSSPNKTQILLLTLMGGLAVGFCGAFLLEYAENGFMTMEQAESTLGLPVLAMLPNLNKNNLGGDGPEMSIPDYLVGNPLSRFGEGVRGVRVNTEMSNIDNPPRVVLVTSAAEAEGKSTLATCYAYSAAMAGKRVLLLDCDLRRAQVTESFDLRGERGLTDVVSCQVEKKQVFRRTELNNLLIVPAGTPNKHPPDLLASQRMLAFITELREVFDAIVIDSPPASLVVDSSILMRMADKAVFVVRWRETPREVVQRAVTSFTDDPRKISGVVLNRVDNTTVSSYSGYYSYANTGYNSYYSKQS